jgi:hypothetical protein
VNNNNTGQLPPQAQIEFVKVRQTTPEQATGTTDDNLPFVYADVVDDERPWRHDSEKLAQSVFRWYTQLDKRSRRRRTAAQPNARANGTLEPSVKAQGAS